MLVLHLLKQEKDKTVKETKQARMLIAYWGQDLLLPQVPLLPDHLLSKLIH